MEEWRNGEGENEREKRKRRKRRKGEKGRKREGDNSIFQFSNIPILKFFKDDTH